MGLGRETKTGREKERNRTNKDIGEKSFLLCVRSQKKGDGGGDKKEEVIQVFS